MDAREVIFILNSMRKHVTNSMSDKEIMTASREEEAIDYAIEAIKEREDGKVR